MVEKEKYEIQYILNVKAMQISQIMHIYYSLCYECSNWSACMIHGFDVLLVCVL